MTTSTRTQARTPAPVTRLQKLARQIIFSLLSTMKAGSLLIITPDGSKHNFGSSNDLAAVIHVHDEEFFLRCLLYSDIGLAESYMDGLIDISSIEGLISWFLLNQHESPILNESPTASRLLNLLGFINSAGHALRPNSKSISKKNIREHYDLGNSFFKIFLDETMTYSSALFSRPNMALHEAQEEKFRRMAAQLKILPSDRVLEVGCGWGGFSRYLAKNYSCKITALTISQQQFDYTQELLKREGLENHVELRLEDYRDHKGSYDKIASIEMIEAVGDKYMDTFIAKLDSLLAKDGLLAMQMITSADSRYETLKSNVDFIQKHIFPGSLLPSLNRINRSMMSCGDLFMVDLFDMSNSYVLTLKRWQENFELNLDKVRAEGFDDRFIRKWKYYFEYCQAAFAMRNVSVVQATYSRPNNLRLARGVRDHA